MENSRFKFRAWDEGNKVMHNDFKFISSGDEGNDWIIFISDKFTLENHETNPFINPSPYFSQQLKKMQYTGLKDKNGVEIYEEDFIKDKDYIFIVKWQSGGFILSPIKYSKGTPYIGRQFVDLQNAQYMSESCEVIGNIYKNPELSNA